MLVRTHKGRHFSREGKKDASRKKKGKRRSRSLKESRTSPKRLWWLEGGLGYLFGVEGTLLVSKV